MKKRDLPVLIGIILFSCWLMWHSFGYKDGNFLFSSKVWSDFGAHIPLIRSFSYGSNLPPEYATFPGEPIRYHFLFYLCVGLLEKAGLNLGLALNSLSALGFSLMLYMIYRYTLLFSRSRRAGILAIILVLFNGSLTFLRFFEKFPLNAHSLTDIIKNPHFVSFAPWDGRLIAAFWNLNIYTNQRHLSFSFALGLIALWPVISTIITKKPPPTKIWYLLSVIFLILPWLHQAVLAMVVIVSLSLFLFEFKILKPIFIPYLACLALSIPGSLFWRYAGINPPPYELGYISNDKTAFGLLKFWFYNFGLYLPLFPIIWLRTPKDRRVILSAFLSLFILANTFRLSTDMINNHKLVNFFWLMLSVETAIFLGHIFRRWYSIPLALILTFFLTFSGIIDFFPIYNDPPGPYPDVPHNETASWIVNHTPKNSVFITTYYFYHPASLAGRKIFLDYGYFNWSLGYNEGERRLFARNLFDSKLTREAACQKLNSYKINYLILSPGKGEVGDADTRTASILEGHDPIFTSKDDYKIYPVTELCYDST